MEAIIRVALTNDGGKWEPGTILGAYPVDTKLGPGELGQFLCIKMDVPSIEEARKWRLVKMIPLDKVLSSVALDTKVAQKTQITQKVLNYEKVSDKDVYEKPDLVTTIDTKLIVDSPENQWPKEDPIDDSKIIEESK